MYHFLFSLNQFHLIFIVKGKEIKELLIAAEMGDVEIIRNIIKAIEQFDIAESWLTQCDKKGRTPLHLACIYGYINVVRFLVKEFIESSKNHDLGLQHLNIADHKGRTSLFHAAAENKVNVVQFLVDRGADLEVATNDSHMEPGSTALMACAEKGNVECFHILLEKGANVLAIRKDGADAAYMAARYGRVEIIEDIAETGKMKLIVNRPTFRGRTALLTAAYHGHIKVCKILHKRGANLDHQDDDNFTALIYAASEGFFDLVKFLVEKGADMHLKDKFGETASMFADASGYYEVASYLSSKVNDRRESSEVIHELQELRRKLDMKQPRVGINLYPYERALSKRTVKKRNSR
jgi:ankyrin repeat protein